MDKEQLQNSSEEQFDTTGLLLAYLANWKWFVCGVVVACTLALFFIASRVPVYQVDASIYLSDDNNSQQNMFNMSAATEAMVSMKNFIDETELEVMKSRNNLVKIVDSLNLSYSYYTEGVLRNTPMYENNAIVANLDQSALHGLKKPIKIKVSPADNGKYNIEASTTFQKVKEEKTFENVNLPFDVEMSYGTVTISRSPVVADFKTPELIVVQNPRAVATKISKNLNIEFAPKSEMIIRLSLRNTVLKRGIDIINALVDFYNRDIIEEKNRSAMQTEAFILDRLVMISDELKDVESRLQQYRQAHNITNIEAQSTLNLTLQSDYEQKLAENDAEMNIVEEIERIVSSAETYQSLPAAVSNTTISQIIENYNRKVSQLNRTLEGSTSDNPLVVSMKEELSRDKVRILQNLATEKRSIKARRAAINKLESHSAGQLASTPIVDKGLQEIFREQQVKVNIYTFLLQRREEIALQKTMATNTARLIDDPADDSLPVSPRKLVILVIAFLLGLSVPAAIIYVRRILFPVFTDKEELERLTKVPVLGEISKVEGNQDAIVVGANVSTSVAELFRLLRNNISFTRSGENSKFVLVTSSISGEGKTFVASNLAMTYALMGKKVLVVGLDLRRPMLAHNLGFNNRRGFTTYLSGQEPDLSKLISQSHANDNLYVLPAGPVPPNPNELLMSDRMEVAMKKMGEDFDYIILDTAPIGLVSDTFLISRYSDIQLYVTRAHYTSRNSLKTLHDAIDTGKLPAAYIVVNGVDMASNAYTYRRYGAYGYSKSKSTYGYGYVSKHKNE